MYSTLKSPKGQARLKIPSTMKVMLIVFFIICVVVHYKFLSSAKTVKKEYYLSVMSRWRNYSKILEKKTFGFFITIMHYVILCWFFATIFVKKLTHFIPGPPYLPDLGHCVTCGYSANTKRQCVNACFGN